MADDQRETATFSSRNTNTDRKERDSSRDEGRRRSRSPRRDRERDRREGRPRRKDAGFKWKEKRQDDTEPRRDRDPGLQRGYRDHYRPRSRSRSPPPRARFPRGYDRDRPTKSDGAESRQPEERKEKKEKKERKAAPPTPSQPMIIVYVNDRLGTKKAIPCYPTDPISMYTLLWLLSRF
ncbi:hypothetical protein HRR95_003340 [Exophiala dermatitidis]|nr:hypothetical protein HRR79_002260 [Exophiala dermatitidis]KAJ4681294.1 hypothetical protein HRR95_003340 [Exophiala dermatitidis]